MVLKCGHHEACIYRYIMYDENKQRIIKKYCMACICEKSEVPEIGQENQKEYKIKKKTNKKKVVR